MYLLILIALIILLLILWFPFAIKKQNEQYDTINEVSYYPYDNINNDNNNFYDPYLATHTNFPFWNTQMGSTRNMSYDLRGDVPIPYYMNVPFNMGTRIPIRNRPLYAIS